MSFTATFVMIFLIAFVVIGGVVMFLSKTIDHGEARFDSETGKQIRNSDVDGEELSNGPQKRAGKAER